ncbi:Membrane protein involved in the export of O-antigen and teichoic acid [Rhizobiales bacterium GAS113]|jgi:O-antigen/teichoic acid export membrane protein|nr:Membrane protein involved in the export of O-antigen and teichoic acid [Rhizobiales bacterium GAS113]
MREGVLASTPVKSVALGSATAFGIHIVGAGLTYCSQLVIARIIGADSFGIYAYVLAWMAVLAYFCALGFDVALLRYVPAYRAEQGWGLLKGVIQYAERRAAAVGILVVSVGMSVVLLVATGMSPALRNTFLIGFLLVPVWALLWIRSAAVRAFGGVAAALVPDRMVRDGLLVGFVAVASFGLGQTIDAPWVMTATLVSSFTGLCLASLAARRLRPRAIDGVSAKYAARIWRQTALPLVIIAAAETLLNRTGVLLLGWSGYTTDAGIYGLAFNMAFLAALPRAAVNTLFAPTISDLFARGDRTTLQALVSQSASWTLCGAACIALVLSVLAGSLLSWFGHGYEAGVPALRILLLGQVFAASAGSQLQVMTMTGHERSAAVLLAACTVVNAGLSALLINLFGLTGAAVAATATLIVWNVAMALFIRRHLQLLPGVLGLPRRRARV